MKTGLLEVVPGAATVCTWTSGRRSTLSRTTIYNAMSIENAMRVRRAAMKEMKGANRAIVTCDEKRNIKRAIKVAPVAAVQCEMHQCPERFRLTNRDMPNRCTARPRVEPDPIVTLFESDMSCVE